MNKKLVLTGKAVLSTVMASTMACSMLSTNILAQEPEVVPEEETTVEKTPVEEEPTETPEEATGGNEETTPSNAITTNEIVDTPTTYSFPSEYDDSWTEQKLRDEIQRLLNEAASLYEENKYRPSTENDYITKKATAEAALADTTLPKDKLAWQAKYMSDCIKAMNTAQNVLSESAKQIVIINKEVAKLNPSEYRLDAWKALSSALSSAIGRINGKATDDFSEDLANIQSLYEAVLQTKVDENLVTLRDLVAECEVIVNNQYYPSRRVNYTRDSYANFTNALNEARTEVNKGETTIDPAVAQTLIDNLTQAKNNLVVVDENTVGQEYGINDKWLNGWDGNYANYNKSALVRGGSLYISGYKANGDGTVTVTVKWENSGIDPVTGGMFYNVPKQAAYNKYDAEYSYRPFEENDLKNGVKLTSTVELPDGDTDHSAIKVDPLNDDEVLNGFEKDFVVPAGSKINLTLTQKGTTSKAAYTLSLGTYYVPTEAEDTVDKSELKAWIDKINALNPDDYTQKSWKKLQGDLDVAEMFYDLDGLKQEEIDLVVDRLEQNFNALVPADKTAPEVVKIVPNQDGTILVKFSEPVTINDPEWKESENPYEQGGQYWIGTLTEDKIYTVVATDTAGIGVEFTVDHKDPVGNVTYQENEDGTVTVTIAFDERITVNSSTQNPGWTYNEDFTAISKTFDKNAQEQVTVHDNMDNETVVEVNVDSFDETAPEYTVTYSNDGNPTNQDITVIITANEPLQEVEGWTLSDDGLSLTKTYSENKEETVVIADASGNTSEVPVNVTGIDKLGPTVTVKNETTEDGVLVTIETNEPIQTPDGWTKVSDTKYTKLYTENTSEDIIVYDLAGNATKAHVTVSSISKPGTGGSDQDKNQGTDTKKEDSKKTDGTNTGVFVGTGLFAGSATAAAAGASLLAFLKKRKK